MAWCVVRGVSVSVPVQRRFGTFARVCPVQVPTALACALPVGLELGQVAKGCIWVSRSGPDGEGRSERTFEAWGVRRSSGSGRAACQVEQPWCQEALAQTSCM